MWQPNAKANECKVHETYGRPFSLRLVVRLPLVFFVWLFFSFEMWTKTLSCRKKRIIAMAFHHIHTVTNETHININVSVSVSDPEKLLFWLNVDIGNNDIVYIHVTEFCDYSPHFFPFNVFFSSFFTFCDFVEAVTVFIAVKNLAEKRHTYKRLSNNPNDMSSLRLCNIAE